MKSIDFLEHGGGEFHVRVGGMTIPLADPRTLHYQTVLVALMDSVVPGIPPGVPMWMWPEIFDRWC